MTEYIYVEISSYFLWNSIKKAMNFCSYKKLLTTASIELPRVIEVNRSFPFKYEPKELLWHKLQISLINIKKGMYHNIYMLFIGLYSRTVVTVLLLNNINCLKCLHWVCKCQNWIGIWMTHSCSYIPCKLPLGQMHIYFMCKAK